MAADNMALSLENLPERSAPARKPHTAHFLDVDPRTQEKLDECDWDLYEKTVATGLVEAGKRDAASSIRPEEIFQVSIVTDPQRQITQISLETETHAKAAVRELARWLRTRGERYAAEKLEHIGLNPNPVEFHSADYYSILHRELKLLGKIDYGNDENRRAAEVWAGTSRLEVVERVRSLGLLASLPQKDGIWLGVSSPNTLYDHATKI